MDRQFLRTSGVIFLLTTFACVSTSAGPIPVQIAAKSESRFSAPANADVAEKLRQQQIPVRDDIVRSVIEKQQLFTSTGPDAGYLVVGQLKLDGTAKIQDVIAQMEILEDGYFVEAVDGSGIPLYFWHPECDRLEVVAEGKSGEIKNLGVFPMVLSTQSRAVVKGTLISSGSDVPDGIKAVVTYDTR